MNLSGFPVVSTRPKTQSESLIRLIEQYGGVPIQAPLIEIRFIVEELASALRDRAGFDGVIVTSANAVRGLHAAQLLVPESPSARYPLFAIGRATERIALEYGFHVETFPDVHNANDLANALIERFHGQSLRWLIPQSSIAWSGITDCLRNAGHVVTSVVSYETVACPADEQTWRKVTRLGDTVVVLFFSPSAVESFYRQCWGWVQRDGISWLFACIGATTRTACERFGLCVCCTAEEPQEEALLHAVVRYLSRNDPN